MDGSASEKFSVRVRRLVLANGYEPVPALGKAPAWHGWADGPITEQRLVEVEQRHPTYGNTGMRCGHLVGADNDVLDPETAEVVNTEIERILGDSDMLRIGRKPGGCRCYRNETPIGKKDKPQGVEFLGAGQQFIVHGRHPNSGQPYEWPNREKGADPTQRKLVDLVEVTPDQLRAAAVAVAEALLTLGWTKVVNSAAVKSTEPSTRKGEPCSAFILDEMTQCISPNVERKDWLAVIWAVREANLQPDRSDEDRLAALDQWSQGPDKDPCPSYAGFDDVQRAYEYAERSEGRKAGLGTVYALAVKGGYRGPPPTVSLIDEFDRRAPHEQQQHDECHEQQGEAPDDGAQKLKAERAQRLAGFRLRTEEEQDQRPPRRSVVRNLLYRAETTLIFGPEDSFKSFCAVDICLSACAGIPWAPFFEDGKPDGQRLGGYAPDDDHPLVAVYIAGEGVGSIETARRPAWRVFNKIAPERKLCFFTVEQMPRFHDDKDVALFVEAVQQKLGDIKPDIIAIDTVACALTELEENSAKEVGFFIAASDHLKKLYDAAMLHIHHTGKDQKMARGSYRLMTDAEVRIKVTSDKAQRRLTLVQEKNKDAPIWAEPVVMDGKVVTLDGTKDEDGKPITSLAFKRVMPSKAAVAQAVDADAGESSLRREVVQALRAFTTQTVQLEFVAASIADTRTRQDGPWAGQHQGQATAAVLHELRRECRTRPGRKGGAPVPAKLGRFLTMSYVPGATTFLRLPATNAAEVGDETGAGK